MKIKEAIAEIQNMKKFNYTLAPDDVFTMAISALEKQEAKEPIIRTEDIDGLVEGHRAYRKYFDCPNCGSLLKTESWTTVRCFGGGTMLKDNSEISFCPKCGQKIDWTEVDDGN